jgi:internalin A
MNWIDRRIAGAREREATSLDLSVPFKRGPAKSRGRGVLAAIPAAVFDLDHLECLDLRGHDIAEVPTEIGRMTSLRELALTSRGDITVSREIRRVPLNMLSLESARDLALDLDLLPELLDLSLSAGRPQNLDGLHYLRTLTRLTLDFPMESLPKNLRGLPSIRALTLGNRMARQPLALDGLACSETLNDLELSGRWDLSNARMPSLNSLSVRAPAFQTGIPNHFFELPLRKWRSTLSEPDDRLRWLTQLEDLALSGLREPALPPGLLGSLSRLRKLDLQFLAVDPGDLEAVLERGNLEALDILSLALNQPNISLAHCHQLRRLSLYPAVPMEVQGAIDDLTLLEDLRLSSCNPSAVNYLRRLKRLRYLSLRDMHLAGRLVGLSDLTELRVLNIQNTGLKTLPAAVSRLWNLETLVLKGNRLSEVPRDVADLPNLKYLDVADNPITSPPPEIASRGLAAVQGYFDSMREGPVEALYEAKLLLVGEGGVGKTLLARRLLEPHADLGQAPLDLTSTRGIDIRDWPLPAGPGRPFRVHLWDFGGQEIYHATHQFFLTRRSLYLFVWDARKEDREAGFDYWLNAVTLLSAGSPILVVLNKADERVREIDRRSLQEKFPNVRGFHAVSALNGQGIAALIAEIQANVIVLPHVGERWPFSWSRVRALLEVDGRDHIDRDEYLRLCATEGLDQQGAELLSGYLHDLGVILHFQDDPLLGNLVILRPEWATNAVYAVLDTRSVQERLGRFSLQDLVAIWSHTAYPRARHAALLQLMIRFELCFRLGDSQDYIAPELLRAGAPDYTWQTQDEIRLDYRYAFMPAGILTRFIARNHAMIESALYWRNGTVLAWEGARARVVAEPFNRRIRVAVIGIEKRDLLAVIRKELDHIHRTLNEPEVEEMVPCTCPTCVACDPYFHRFRELLAYRQHRIPEVLCPKGLCSVPIDELLEGFSSLEVPGGTILPASLAPPPPEATVATGRQVLIKATPRGKAAVRSGGAESKTLKVFVSYSHEDERMRAKLGQHLAPMVDHGLIRIWHDREINAGADWEEEINREIAEADIILLLVSASFLYSRYCREELQRALDQRSAGKSFPIPIILRPCDWTRVFNRPEYKMQALPRDDRPVAGGRWPNQDAAFANIAKELRKKIEHLRS